MIRTPMLLTFALLIGAGAEDSPKKLLASKKVEDRLLGIFMLSRDHAEPDAEALLIAALEDKDWEVVEKAAEVLATLGGAKSVSPLVNTVLRGPARRTRLAAARALRALAPQEAATELADRLKGDDVGELVDAMAEIGGSAIVPTLLKLGGSKKPELQHAARLALGAVGGAEQAATFNAMLADKDLEVRIAGMRGLARIGDDAALAALLGRLKARLSDVEERRVRAALLTHLKVRPAAERSAAVEALLGKISVAATPRHARLVADLDRDADLHEAREAVLGTLSSMATAADPQLRAAAVHALATHGGDDHARLLDKCVREDAEARVRFHALRALVAIRGPDAAGTLAAAITQDRSDDVREEAAALCGLHHIAGAEAALIDALGARAWPVMSAAAISLGKLRHAEARPQLVKLLTDGEWQKRASAALALAMLRDKEAVDVLIERLVDKDETVRATITNGLRRITGQLTLEKKPQWSAWWKKNRETAAFIDPQQRTADADRYSPGTAYTFYEDLDVVAIQAPRPGGDHIEQLLDRYKIKHRLTGAGQVSECGLHPFAIAVSNCSGEILPDDIERVEWFVRGGGYLFASCWSLTMTVEKAFPGIVHMHQTPTQVLDEVTAEPLSDAGVMRSVIRPGTRTRYVLEGSHLIAVQDAERFEVLIDSPQCAARWGEGNLAGWFSVGHGLVFDSANHFDLQGMKKEVPDSAQDRKVMAMDILGYSHEELRELEHQGVLKSAKRCTEELEDLSMFRLITNFVMKKRRAEF